MRSPKILAKFPAPICHDGHGRIPNPLGVRIVQKNMRAGNGKLILFLQWMDDGGHVVDEARLPSIHADPGSFR